MNQLQITGPELKFDRADGIIRTNHRKGSGNLNKKPDLPPGSKPEEVFNSAMREALDLNEKLNRVFDRKGVDTMNEVADGLTELFGKESTEQFVPGFTTGFASVNVSNVHLEGDEVLKFRSILDKCTAAEISPNVSESLEVALTIKGVLTER